MNEQSPDQPEHESPNDLLQLAIESMVSDTIPDGPPAALDVATLRTLAELDRPPRRSFPFVPRTRIMKFAAIAASLAVVVSLLRLWTPTVDSSAAYGNIFYAALKQMREARSMSYVEETIVEGKKNPIIVKEFFAEDGRKRSEIGSGAMTMIFDTAGHIRLALLDFTKILAEGGVAPTDPRPDAIRTAIIGEPKEDLGINPGEAFRTWLQHLKGLGDRPEKVLGTKELDGKLVTGFVVTQDNRTFTMWTDNATGEPVRIEFDSELNGAAAHVTMKDFHFHVALEKSLFSLDVPAGYRIHGMPENGKIESPAALELAWSIKGDWSGVARAPDRPALYALESGGRLAELNGRGEVVATSRIGNQPGSIRTANLIAGQKPGLLRFSPSSPRISVDAYNAEGEHLWSYPEKKEAGDDQDMIGDVWPADLDGDGRDEIIIGYLGLKGLHVLDPMGKLLWKNTDRGNIWHVTAGNLNNDPRPEVLATAADGKVHIYAWQGKYLRYLDPGFYAHTVRWWQPSQQKAILHPTQPSVIQTQDAAEPGVVIVAGFGPKARLAAFDSRGEAQWSSEISAPVAKTAIAVERPWLVLSFQDGNVRVVDLATGNEIAHLGGQGGDADVAWLPADESPPLLVIATKVALQAYRMTPSQP